MLSENDVVEMKLKLVAVVVGIAGLSLVPFLSFAATRQSAASAHAPRPQTMARNPYLGAIAVEARTGRILFEDQADVKGYPASVLKLMDLLLILERIERGQLSLRDQVAVSAKAAQAAESKVYLSEGESFSLEEMLYALMVKSANDAAVALAEKVAGSTDAFIQLMNARALELGMTSTRFHSVHGLPPAKGEEHDVTTARDLTILCREVLKHPEALRYTSTQKRVFRPNGGKRTVTMWTHNHLLGRVEGCDGLKTGYISAAGFSIAATAVRNRNRVVVVVLDSMDSRTRDAKAKELLAKGFAALSPPAAAERRATSVPKKRH